MANMDVVCDKSTALSCATTAEDKELDCEALCDIRGVHLASSESKTANALKHFNIFLASCCKKINAPFVDCHHLTYHGVKTSGTFEEANVWWDNKIGNFFSYLHKDAYKCGERDKGRVSRMKQQQVMHQASRCTTPTISAIKAQS